MKISRVVGISFAAALLGASVAWADMPAKEEFKEQIPVAEPVAPPAPECGWDFRLSGGVPIYFFARENTKGTGGMYFDAFPCTVPLNLRIGGEVRHMTLNQPAAEPYASSKDGKTHVTYLRIPMAAEYVYPITEEVNLYLGGGPDLINVANDIGDFTVGLHIGGRLQYELDKAWSVALESGYMWGRVSDGHGTVRLDGGYLIPTIGYRF